MHSLVYYSWLLLSLSRLVVTTSVPTALDIRSSDAPYSVPVETLAAALDCPDGFDFPRGRPTLLVPGTAEVAAQAYGAGYFTQLKQDGYEPCYVNIDKVSLGDAQVTAEYVAYNIDQLYRKAGNTTINVVAHSQANINTQWALLFWPSTQKLVRSFVSLVGDFKGTVAGPLICTAEDLLRGGCTVAFLQQTPYANFVKVLQKNANRGLVPTTTIYTETDDVVQPEFPESLASSALNEGNAYNVALQSVCPGRIADHWSMLVDPVAYAVALDALNHNGTASKERVSQANPTLCAQIKPIGADTAESIVTAMRNLFNDLVQVVGYAEPLATKEPDLKPYAAGYL